MFWFGFDAEIVFIIAHVDVDILIRLEHVTGN